MMDRVGYSSTAGLRFAFPAHNIVNHASSTSTAHSHADVAVPPLFERINTDDMAELNSCRLLIDALQQRVHVLEKINLDLESRLENQALESIDIERQILEATNKLRTREQKLNQERDEWTAKFLKQEHNSERLREHLSRTERELYGILQKKYELMRPVGGGGGGGGGTAGSGGSAASSSRANIGIRNKSWDNMKKEESAGSMPANGSDDFLATLQARAPPEIRQKRVIASLQDFFDI